MALAGDRVLLKCAFNPSTGYGIDGITLAQELIAVGADVHLEPLFVGIPLPPDVAYLFTKPRPDHFECAIVHVDPGQLEAPPGLALAADKVIGWTMWEFTSMRSESWAKGFTEQVKYFDNIIAYDQTSKQALSEYVPEDRLSVLQGGYSPKLWTVSKDDPERDWSGTFKFGMVGALNQRKNPFASIKAFEILKDKYGDEFDAELHLKNIAPTLHPAMMDVMPWLKIYYENWPHQKLRQFYLSLNCLLAPSWGEGKNLPALEAQTMGVPVIASKCGGHMQWADPEWAYLIDGQWLEHVPGHKSLRVNYQELADLMWHVYTHKEEAKYKGELASRYIPQQCDWSSVVEKLGFLIEDIKPQPRSL